MSQPTTQSINYIITTTTEGLTNDNNKLDTSGKVQERIQTAISSMGNIFIEEQPTANQTISGHTYSLTVEGPLIVGDGTNAVSTTLNGNTSTTGSLTSGGALTVGTSQTNANATINGNTTTTGTLTSGGALTVGTAQTNANATVNGNVSCSGDVSCATLTLPIFQQA